MAAHSNDFDGSVVGNLKLVPRRDWPASARRKLRSGSFIPQSNHTHQYFTKVDGYASLNEFQVGLAESTWYVH